MTVRLRQLLFLALVAVSQASLALDVTALARHLSTDFPITGQFVQERFIEGFPKPIISKGEFTFVSARGLVWQTQQPFANRVVVLNDKLITENEFESQQINSDQTPQLTVFNSLAMALFSGDLSFLQSQFQISASGTLSAWRMTLTPRQAPLNTVFQKIDLQGSRYAEKISLWSTQKELTRVTLSGQKKASQLPKELRDAQP